MKMCKSKRRQGQASVYLVKFKSNIMSRYIAEWESDATDKNTFNKKIFADWFAQNLRNPSHVRDAAIPHFVSRQQQQTFQALRYEQVAGWEVKYVKVPAPPGLFPSNRFTGFTDKSEWLIERWRDVLLAKEENAAGWSRKLRESTAVELANELMALLKQAGDSSCTTKAAKKQERYEKMLDQIALRERKTNPLGAMLADAIETGRLFFGPAEEFGGMERAIGDVPEEQLSALYIAISRATLGVIFVELDAENFGKHFRLSDQVVTVRETRKFRKTARTARLVPTPTGGFDIQLLEILCLDQGYKEEWATQLPYCKKLKLVLGFDTVKQCSIKVWRDRVVSQLMAKEKKYLRSLNLAENELYEHDLQWLLLERFPPKAKLHPALTQLETLVLGENRVGALGDWFAMDELKRSLKWLSLYKNQLYELPLWVGGFEKLLKLDLEGNYLKSLPGQVFAGLPALKILWLQNNPNLKELPDEIGQLQSLTDLLLGNTGIRQVPSCIRGLRNLKTLSMRGCPLLKSLQVLLSKLNTLYLEFTTLQEIPASFAELTNLKTVTVGTKMAGLFEGKLAPGVLRTVRSNPEEKVLRLFPVLNMFRLTLPGWTNREERRLRCAAISNEVVVTTVTGAATPTMVVAAVMGGYGGGDGGQRRRDGGYGWDRGGGGGGYGDRGGGGAGYSGGGGYGGGRGQGGRGYGRGKAKAEAKGVVMAAAVVQVGIGVGVSGSKVGVGMVSKVSKAGVGIKLKLPERMFLAIPEPTCAETNDTGNSDCACSYMSSVGTSGNWQVELVRPSEKDSQAQGLPGAGGPRASDVAGRGQPGLTDAALETAAAADLGHARQVPGANVRPLFRCEAVEHVARPPHRRRVPELKPCHFLTHAVNMPVTLTSCPVRGGQTCSRFSALANCRPFSGSGPMCWPKQALSSPRAASGG
eukprot:g62895.t1